MNKHLILIHLAALTHGKLFSLQSVSGLSICVWLIFSHPVCVHLQISCVLSWLELTNLQHDVSQHLSYCASCQPTVTLKVMATRSHPVYVTLLLASCPVIVLLFGALSSCEAVLLLVNSQIILGVQTVFIHSCRHIEQFLNADWHWVVMINYSLKNYICELTTMLFVKIYFKKKDGKVKTDLQ